MAVKEYFLPQSLDEAIGLLAQHGPALLVMAGGTITMALVNEGIVMPEKVMGLRQAQLDYVRQANGTVILGATTTLNQLLELKALPMVQQAAQNAAGWSVRNMATVGGNIFAPAPAGDVAVALLALDASLTLAGPTGRRVLPLAEFYTAPRQPNELLAEIEIPLPAGKTAYIKYGRKHANTPAVVTVAAHVLLAGERITDARIALNAAGPHPFRATTAEAALIGSPLNEETIAAAAAAAMAQANPLTDAIASAAYRRKMVGVFVKRVLTQIATQER